MGCSSLTSIVIPSKVQYIVSGAFYWCESLQSITIENPDFSGISEKAFYGCTNLTDVYFAGTKEQWNNVDIYTYVSGNEPILNATIHCSDGVITPTTGEDVAAVSLEPGETEPTEPEVVETQPEVTEEATEPTEAVTEPTEAATEPTEAATEPIPEETEVVTEATEAVTEATEEPTEATVDAELLSDRSWRVLPGGAAMQTGGITKLAAFTGKESTKNGVRTVSFTGLEPGEDYALIVSLVPGSLEPDDLQYITQSTANDTGTLTLSYIPRTDVNAIVQLYGIPTDRGITLDRDYVTMKTGAASESLTATVTPAQWADTLTWASSDETVLAVGADGSLTPVAPGTAYAIATVTHGKYTLAARCRVDVTEEVANVAVTAVDLGIDSVTTQLYSRSYVNFDVLLLLEQNLPQVAAFSLEEDAPQDNGVAITGAKFADETVRSLFDLQVKDDRTLVVIPTQAAIESGKTVKSSYSSQVIVSVNGVEFRTPTALTLKVKKDAPKLTAKALTFNSFYTGQTQAISITGGTVTGITGTMPDWLTLEDGKLALTGTKTKASTTLTLSVETEEWAIPATVKVKTSVSYKAPALKLNKTSLTFANSGSTGIPLTLKAGKQTPADLGVKDIVPGEGFAVENLDLEAGTFTLCPTGDTVPTGKQTITVSFYGTTATLPLTLKTSAKAPTLKLSRSTVTLNAVTGDSVTLKVTANPSDFDLTKVTVSDPSETFAVSTVDAQGNFTVATTGQALPGRSYTLEVSAPGSKTVKLKVTTLSAKAVPSMTVSAKGSIDLTYPERGLSILPKMKNYSGDLATSSYTLAVKTGKVWEEREFSEYFQIDANGMLCQTADFSLAAGTLCRITLSGTLPDGTVLSASAQVKVTQTAIPLKLSKSTVTLNKTLEEWASVAVSTSVKGYSLGIPAYELLDAKGNPSDGLHLTWENGKLRIAVTEDTAFGATYKVRIWETSNKISTLTVKILAQNKSGISVTARGKGSIDVIRDSTAILITPTYKNWAGETPLDKQVTILQAPDKKNYTLDVTGSFTWQWLENGQLKLQKQPGAYLEPGGKYRLELTAAGSKAATVALTVKSGTAKASCRAVTLYKKDSNSQAVLVFTLSDTTLNPLEWVEIKGAKQQSQFEILPWSEGQFAIALTPDAPSKTTKLTLQLFFQGNPTNTANASAPLTVTIR